MLVPWLFFCSCLAFPPRFRSAAVPSVIRAGVLSCSTHAVSSSFFLGYRLFVTFVLASASRCLGHFS